MATLDRVLNLTQKALDEFDDRDMTVTRLLHRCERIARLRNDFVNLVWLQMEGLDIEQGREHSQIKLDLLSHFTEEEASQVIREALIGYIGRRKVDSKGGSDSRPVQRLEQTVDELEALMDGLDVPPGMASIDTYHYARDLAKTRIETTASLRPTKQLLGRIRTRLHDFLVQTEYELEYGALNSTVFDRSREYVDQRLHDIAPEALAGLVSAYRRSGEGDPEARSQALTSCRRVLKALADAIFAPTSEKKVGNDGISRSLTDDKYINRLLQAVSETLGEHGHGEVLQGALTDLGSRLRALNDLSSKGVHASVTAAEVDTCVIQTYLVVGDVLRIVDGTSALSARLEQETPKRG